MNPESDLFFYAIYLSVKVSVPKFFFGWPEETGTVMENIFKGADKDCVQQIF
jgi:hypothetical protein